MKGKDGFAYKPTKPKLGASRPEGPRASAMECYGRFHIEFLAKKKDVY